MNNVPFVSIIIPTYKDWKRLYICLQALETQTYPEENIEIIVVNNAPNDKKPQEIKLPANCLLISESKPGSYSARNKALNIAKGKYFFFTDSDCIPDENWIKNGVDYFEKHPGVPRLGGDVIIFPKVKDNPTGVEIHDILYAFRQKRSIDNSGACVTANLAVQSELFKKVGVFDDTLKSGGDFEWNRRAQSKGFKIHYLPEMIVNHPARESYEELLKKAHRVARGYYNSIGKKQSILSFMFYVLKKYKPGFSNFLIAYKNDKYSFRKRMYAFWCVNYRLELSKAKELIRYRIS